MASAYEDGISSPKVNSFKYGFKLPPARLLSNYLHYDKPDRFFYTSAVMSFGQVCELIQLKLSNWNKNAKFAYSNPTDQFINHDLTFTPSTKPEFKGGLIDCCKKTPPVKLHPQCLPIELDANDYQAKNYGKTCISFVRSAPCPLCSLGPREHLNTVTSFLDLSVTYGSSKEEQDKLRTFKNGLLKFSRNKYGNVLLPRSETDDQCSSKSNSHYCFTAGDVRGNQHPMLQTFHLLFLRNHNQIAENLAKVNPKWSDEILFQEARRINNAEYQHIVYEEYLPLIFGRITKSWKIIWVDWQKHLGLTVHQNNGKTNQKNFFSL